MPKSKWPIIWNARWIWASPAASPVSPIAPAGIPPRETWNRFCYLRRTINLTSIPPSVPARVTADSRFVLFVNGVEISRGPARSVPERLAWTEIDLAPFLRIGRNAIAALARFYGLPGPWWRPAPPSFLIGFESSAGTFAPNRKRIPVEPFTSPEHDDIAPLTAIDIAFTELSRRAVASLDTDDPRHAYPTADASADGPDSIVTYDAGMITLATPWAVVRGP